MSTDPWTCRAAVGNYTCGGPITHNGRCGWCGTTDPTTALEDLRARAAEYVRVVTETHDQHAAHDLSDDAVDEYGLAFWHHVDLIRNT